MLSRFNFIVTAGALCLTGISPKALGQLEEVVVTAQKREESVQDVPITIQAFTGEQISDLGIENAIDVTKLAPNLNVSNMNPALQSLNIRGVGTKDFFGNATGSVGIYMDEVTMSAPYLSGLGLYDMERVEVLRGPQNSLFGRNTTGGAVNYISRLPVVGGTDDGYVRAAIGSFARFDLEAAGSFSLNDTTAIRIAGKSYDRDGNFNNLAAGGADYGEKDRKSLRGTLVFEPSDLTSVIVNLHWAQEDSQITPYRQIGLRAPGGDPQFFAVPGPGPLTVLPGPQSTNTNGEVDWTTNYGGFNAQGQPVDTTDWNDIYRVGDDRHKIDTWGFYLKVEHELDFATLTSITSFDDSENQFTLDLGGPGLTPADITMINAQDHANEQFSQEIRLASPADERFRWIAGLYYYNEDSTMGQNMGFGPFSPLPPPTFQPPVDVLGLGLPPIQFGGSSAGLLYLTGGRWSLPVGAPVPGPIQGNQAGFSIAQLENEVISPYLHSEFDLNDRTTLTVGLRYTDDTKKIPSALTGNVDTSSLGRDVFRSNAVIRTLAAGLPLCDLDGDGNNINFEPDTPDNVGRPCAQDLRRNDLNFDEWGGKVGLDFQLNDQMMVYGSFSRGFRSGKYDIEFFHGPQTGFFVNDLNVETLDAWEFGLKSDLLEGNLQLNLAAFFYTWNDQQLFIVDPATGPSFTNVDESELFGVEAEFRWLVGDGLFIQGGVGMLDTEITNPGQDPFDLVENGHELPFASNLSANVLVVKDIPLGANMLTLQTDLQYRDESFTDVFTSPTTDTYEEFLQMNIRGTYRFGDVGQYSVSFIGENITEEEYCGYELDLLAFSGTSYCLPNDGQALFAVEASIDF